jgi:hypothetical protein
MCLLLFEKLDDAKVNDPDWYNDVGPILKKMALLFPIMQLVVPFYEYIDISKVIEPF